MVDVRRFAQRACPLGGVGAASADRIARLDEAHEVGGHTRLERGQAAKLTPGSPPCDAACEDSGPPGEKPVR